MMKSPTTDSLFFSSAFVANKKNHESAEETTSRVCESLRAFPLLRLDLDGPPDIYDAVHIIIEVQQIKTK